MAWLAVFALAGALGWVGTRLVRDFAPRFGLVDAPDGRRKLQSRPIPIGGGLAVLVATLIATCLAVAVMPEVRAVFWDNQVQALSLLAAALVITAVGLVDDVYDLRARYKLLGQLAAVTLVVIPGGILIKVVSILGSEVHLGWAAYPVTYLFFLAAINALNLLDGMDGLLGTVGLIVCAALAAMAELNGFPLVGIVALALAGSLAGFLRYNLPPATIYMGDCGSMLVGLVVAAVAIQASVKSHAVVMIAPTSLLVLPLLDTTAAIIRRQLSGRGWATADRDHLHHVLLRGGLTVRRVLLLVAALGGVAALGAVVGMRYRNDLISLITAAGVVLMLVASGLFGSAELRLIRQRAYAALAAARGRAPTVVEVRVADHTHWPEVWSALTESAGRLGLKSLALDTFDGREPFRRAWANSNSDCLNRPLWQAELGLRDNGLPAARVIVTGEWDAEPVAAKLADLARVIEAIASPTSESSTRVMVSASA